MKSGYQDDIKDLLDVSRNGSLLLDSDLTQDVAGRTLMWKVCSLLMPLRVYIVKDVSLKHRHHTGAKQV